MKAVKVNLHNCVDEKTLLSYQDKVKQIHDSIMNKTVAEKDWLGWLELPNKGKSEEVKRMKKIAELWESKNIEVVVEVSWGKFKLLEIEFIYSGKSR